MTAEEIKAANPIVTFLGGRGVEFRKSGGELITSRCPVTKHKPSHLCVSINEAKGVWNCNDCNQGGSILDWFALEHGVAIADAIRELDDPLPIVTKASDEIEATYDYADENGKTRFQVLRYKPKTFRQRQPDGKGGWIWNLNGVSRVPFNLAKVLNAKIVLIPEGEKDCLALEKIGFVATTNAGGSKGWLPAYAEFLKGKDVIVVPDSDEAGAKHADAIVASLLRCANSVKKIALPAKDSSDYIASFETGEKAALAIQALIDVTPHTLKPLPLYTLADMEEHYRAFVKQSSTRSLDLRKIFPRLGAEIRHPLLPGELVLILADTGVGKSALCQTIARGAAPLPTLFFELELPLDMMFVRFVQMEVNCKYEDVMHDYAQGSDPLWQSFKGLHHIVVCPESGITTADIESYILRSELKIGCRPALVFVDYAGLVHTTGARSRYEAVSNTAEAMKVIAKRTETIIVMASQVSRPAKDKRENLEIHLHDGKDSGSLENSAGLILGCWRPEPDKMVIKVLKNSKRIGGAKIEMDFNGSRMKISEAALEIIQK